MVVGVLSLELSLPGCSSLKEKRSVIRSIKDRLRHRYNVSVAETAYQDVKTRAELTVALVATDGRFACLSMESWKRLPRSGGSRCANRARLSTQTSRS